MTWAQLHERMAFMTDLIERAEVDPQSALDLHGREDEIRRLFGNEEGLLLSLRHRWMTMLAARLDQAVHDDFPADQARAELVAGHPGLRALLDAAAGRSVRMRSLQRGEQRIVDIHSAPDADRQTVA